MQFQDIENLADEILSKDKGIFFGVDHDDIFFHEYLANLILSLKKKYNIYFLLEASPEYVSELFDNLNPVETENLKNVISQNKIQFPILTAALVHRSGIRVKGIDIPLSDISKLHDPNLPADKLNESLAERTLKQGDAMVKNTVHEIRQANKNDKYIILGGPMHGDVPKKLEIKSINVFENKNFLLMTQDFSSLARMKALANREELKPNYVFFYDTVDVNDKLLSQTKIKPEPTLSPNWMPAFSSPSILQGDFSKNMQIPIINENPINNRTQNFFQADPAETAHQKLLSDIEKIYKEKNILLPYLRDAIIEKNYSKALRIACTNANHITSLLLIETLFKYKEILTININEQVGAQSYSALHHAASKCNEHVYNYLIKKGANDTLKDLTEKTPKDVLEEQKKLKVTQKL